MLLIGTATAYVKVDDKYIAGIADTMSNKDYGTVSYIFVFVKKGSVIKTREDNIDPALINYQLYAYALNEV